MISKIKTVNQLIFCLIKLRKYKEAEEIVYKNFIGTQESESYYPLGLIYAGQGKISEAIEKLKLEIKKNPGRKESKDLLFKLLIQEASVKANQKDWKSLSSVLSLAFELAPDSEEAKKEFLRFKNMIPMSFLKEGNRDKCTELLKEELENDINNPWMIHSMALIYYWWAVSEEEKNLKNSSSEASSLEKLDQIWDNTIAYWTLLTNLNEFWNMWRDEKKELWGMDIPLEIVEEIKSKLLNEKLYNAFINFIDKYKIQNRADDVARHKDYLTRFLMEKKSSRYYKECISDPIKSGKISLYLKVLNKKVEDKLKIPGGYLFFKEYNLLNEVFEAVTEYFSKESKNEKLGMLKIIYSPEKLGKLIILAEDSDNPQKALDEMHKVTGSKKNITGKSEIHRYVYAFLLTKRGTQLSEEGNVLTALELWTSAKDIFEGNKKRKDGKSFDSMFLSLEKKLDETIVTICEQDAKRKNQAKKIKEAIEVLELAIILVQSNSLKEHLAILYCDEALDKLNNKKYSEARKYFEKALALVPGHERAKKGIGTTYNNEGVSTTNMDKAIQLFEKARTYDPDNDIFITNLAGAYNSKAVSILNALSNYSNHYDCDPAIKYLKDGLKLLNPKLDISIIETFAYVDEYTFNSMINKLPDDLYKTMLKNLWVGERSKKNLRGY